MELLAGGVPGIQGDDLLGAGGLAVQARPPALQFDLGDEQVLAVAVDGALGETHHPPHRMDLSAQVLLNALVHEPHPLAGSGLDPAGLSFGPGQPGVGILLARVPLDEEVGPGLDQLGTIGPRIVGTVQAHQQGRTGEPPAGIERALQHIGELLLAVPAALAQLQGHGPTLSAQIGRHRRIAVEAMVGTGHPFLGGAAVVHGKDIDVQRHMAAVQGGDRRPHPLHEVHGGRVHVLGQGTGILVEALAQPGRRGQLADAQGGQKEAVAAGVVHRLEVALAQTQLTHIGADQLDVGDAMALRDVA